MYVIERVLAAPTELSCDRLAESQPWGRLPRYIEASP